ncbi:hypothetical protein ACF3MZ_01410 [Paenibacillaceae bacterium WGS1546]|uniref:hypothetical protein n=1 Tax=Cohnella sp. WGS1546 TaxID=3366810 RepID=UPI00372D4891
MKGSDNEAAVRDELPSERGATAEQAGRLALLLNRLSHRAGLPALRPEHVWHPGVDEEIAALSPSRLSDGSPEGMAAAAAYKAALHLWNDSLAAAHDLVEHLATSTGAAIHGIMHRREGDYDNAKYWFRRADEHPAYHGLQARAAAYLRESGSVGGPVQEALSKIATQGSWNPYLFVNAVAIQEARLGEEQAAERLEYVQQLELEAFMRYLEGRIAGIAARGDS